MVQGDGDYHDYSWIINQCSGVEVLHSWFLADRDDFDYHHRVFTAEAENQLRWGVTNRLSHVWCSSENTMEHTWKYHSKTRRERYSIVTKVETT